MEFKSMPPERLKQYVFKQTAGKLSTDIKGESVIMDLPSGTYSSFNAVGSLIWNELQNENGFFPILESILDHFEVERTPAYAELADFLELLQSKNLISARLKTEPK